jgi:Flp pilus assembly protein TadG
MTPKPPANRTKSRGQNLVELALTLPFVLVMLFFIIDMGRAWFVYEGAKVAAMEGAHAASVYHNEAVGNQQLTNKLAAAGLTCKTNCTVTQIPNQHAYQANVTVTFTPFFAGVKIPTVSGSIPLLPGAFDINYKAVEDVAVY